MSSCAKISGVRTVSRTRLIIAGLSVTLLNPNSLGETADSIGNDVLSLGRVPDGPIDGFMRVDLRKAT